MVSNSIADHQVVDRYYVTITVENRDNPEERHNCAIHALFPKTGNLIPQIRCAGWCQNICYNKNTGERKCFIHNEAITLYGKPDEKIIADECRLLVDPLISAIYL